MARGDATWYATGLAALMNGDVDLAVDTIKVMLTTSAYIPDYDLHDFKNDVTNELSGTGYTAGGATLGSKAITVDTTDNEAVFDGADTVWTGINAGTAAWAVIYKDTGVASTSQLLATVDMAALVTNGGDVTLQWSTEGILNLTRV